MIWHDFSTDPPEKKSRTLLVACGEDAFFGTHGYRVVLPTLWTFKEVFASRSDYNAIYTLDWYFLSLEFKTLIPGVRFWAEMPDFPEDK